MWRANQEDCGYQTQLLLCPGITDYQTDGFTEYSWQYVHSSVTYGLSHLTLCDILLQFTGSTTRSGGTVIQQTATVVVLSPPAL